MKSHEIRQQFLDFFASKGHKIVPAAPVIPYDDPTLLFTNAGMNQFKDVFLGTGSRDYKRAADSQVCIRVSGKHNDLEEVGYDTYHHTLFEMLGNWSFGDYYKKEAIEWAWELLTEVWKLPKNRLYATVYKNDDEALELWKTCTDINPNHILKFGEKDNFWEMGETGPCGPCSEIHINLSDNPDDASLVNAGSPLCIEIWNLVFIQYNREKDGTLIELPAKHVDTGMGFERIVSVLQGKPGNNYETDVFTPLLYKISELSGLEYKDENHKIAMRVIADHIRTLAFAIADGAIPSNEGRGYVLRRILRRAARYGRKLNLIEPFLYKIIPTLVEQMGTFYPQLANNQQYIEKVILAEEQSFNATLDRGIELFEEIANKSNFIDGQTVYKLYDTYGFPVDLTQLLAKEKNIKIDIEGFEKLLKENKERNRKITKDKQSNLNLQSISLENFNLPADFSTEFTGYEELETIAQIIAHITFDNSVHIIANKSPMYVESGGQISDSGKIIYNNQEYIIKDVYKIGNAIVHVIENIQGITNFENIKIKVDKIKRYDTKKNHTATHLLHAALRKTLGNHVQQAGSQVTNEKLRFDFNHFNKITKEELKTIENLVNQKIREQLPVIHLRNIPIQDAKNLGALMFFGDKYGEFVNVIKIDDFSAEFCGGTHVSNTSEIGIFKILYESSIAAGVRRIEATTGLNVLSFIDNLNEEKTKLQETIEENQHKLKLLEKELEELNLKNKENFITQIIEKPAIVDGLNIYKSTIDAKSMDELKAIGDILREKIKSGIGVLSSVIDNKVMIVCVVSDDLIKNNNLSAGKIVGDLAKIVGGGGGGKQHLATAGGKDTTKLDLMISSVEDVIKKYL
ncbi:MAG TPA: alanine--tRNA ligase [Ignavibacteriales bacterium]|nr:alanine--tRNA ligase [Ignavibacteriales bacterium]HOL81658.1 alanine--tRNA ligase [Ignavibacteriales bacterium]HOM65161.1 alanine--tRNA ligase [Ignavibacteriales bacterium]HPD66885.1 alanine--tRNA ligase [Ignavibacteriales bacterium]HPP33772.1 alanine--tRNA ligase [Ignavibacteriales bacterium]